MSNINSKDNLLYIPSLGLEKLKKLSNSKIGRIYSGVTTAPATPARIRINLCPAMKGAGN